MNPITQNLTSPTIKAVSYCVIIKELSGSVLRCSEFRCGKLDYWSPKQTRKCMLRHQTNWEVMLKTTWRWHMFVGWRHGWLSIDEAQFIFSVEIWWACRCGTSVQGLKHINCFHVEIVVVLPPSRADFSSAVHYLVVETVMGPVDAHLMTLGACYWNEIYVR